MGSTATTRHGVTAAPAGFSVVQDFVNTDGGGRPDLLAELCSAQRWAAAALADRAAATGVPAPALALTERDLGRLAGLRTRLRQALHHQAGSGDPAGWIVARRVSAALQQAGDGTVVPSPQGTGWRLVASLLMIESLAAQAAQLWPRLKVCRDEACGVAFYDRSRNNSGVWHNVLICGNAVNLRTSRARRRARAGAAPDAGPPSGT